MRDHKSFVPILIWFATGVALLVAFMAIGNPFAIVGLLPLALLFFVGWAVVLIVAYVRNAIRQRDKRSWIAVASIPALVVLLVVIAPLLARIVIYAEFARMLPTYSRVVESVTNDAATKVTDEIEYVVDPGPPVRIGFPNAGVIDNWSGVIYDPSDTVARPGMPQDIRMLFGGDLVSCWRIYRHYYSCSFT